MAGPCRRRASSSCPRAGRGADPGAASTPELTTAPAYRFLLTLFPFTMLASRPWQRLHGPGGWASATRRGGPRGGRDDLRPSVRVPDGPAGSSRSSARSTPHLLTLGALLALWAAASAISSLMSAMNRATSASTGPGTSSSRAPAHDPAHARRQRRRDVRVRDAGGRQRGLQQRVKRLDIARGLDHHVADPVPIVLASSPSPSPCCPIRAERRGLVPLDAGRRLRVRHRLGGSDGAVQHLRRELRQLREHVQRHRRRRGADAVVLHRRAAAARRRPKWSPSSSRSTSRRRSRPGARSGPARAAKEAKRAGTRRRERWLGRRRRLGRGAGDRRRWRGQRRWRRQAEGDTGRSERELKQLPRTGPPSVRRNQPEGARDRHRQGGGRCRDGRRAPRA